MRDEKQFSVFIPHPGGYGLQRKQGKNDEKQFSVFIPHPSSLIPSFMTPERWQQIKTLFEAVMEQPATRRADFLAQACADDAELRRRIEQMLDADAQPDDLLDQGVYAAAANLLASREAESLAERPTEILAEALAGTQLGVYQILRELGRGGMGAVYLARDTRLERRVALKLLPTHLTGQAERVRRFEREARSVSALNHPNIVTLYDFGQADGRHYIATEFVEGRTLRAALDSPGLTLAQALDVAAQVASALAAAHQAGIVHRDIKPENLMLRPDGYVKVLDFGLAKLTESRTSADEAATVDSASPGFETRTGMVLGTVSYMSPEQAAGQKVDARTDLFSLGVVLYEMLTGHRPFEGRTRNHTLVAILDTEPPPLSSYIADAPVELESIIKRALCKDKEQRYQTAQELLDDLRKLKRELELQTSAPSVGAVTKSNAALSTGKIKLHQRAAFTISAALVLGLAAVAYWLYRSAGESKPATPFQPMQITRLNTPRSALDAAISPDGKQVAYVTSEGERQTVWLKQLATNSDTQLIPPTEMSYRWLTFSPDGNYLYFVANKESEPRALYQMPALGGPARKLAVRLRTPFSFSPDGKRVAFVRGLTDDENALFVADVTSGEEQKLAVRKQPGWFSYRGPAWSPDGKVIVCSASSISDRFSMTLLAVRVADGTVSPLTARQWPGVHRVAWLHDGSGLVLVVSEQISWEPEQLWFLSYPDGAARRITNDLSSYSQYHLSLTADSGALLALKSDTVCNIWVAPNSARGQAKQLTFGSAGRGDGLHGLAWTPDDKLVYSAFVARSEAIFSMKADGSEARQLTAGDHRDRVSTIMPDGRQLLFQSTRAGRWNIWRVDLDGNNPRQLTNGTNDLDADCSPDGKWLFYVAAGRLHKVALDGGEPIRLFEQSAAHPAVSPDGKLVAFPYFDVQVNTRRVAVISTETGQRVKSFDFGYYWDTVHWTPDGHAVAYIKTQGDVSNLWAQPLAGGPPVRLTNFKSELIFNFAWSNDGKQLALARGSETSDAVLIRDFR